MTNLPEVASHAWDKREGPQVLTTVDADGKPNSVYVLCVKKYSDDKIIIVDNKFNKTRQNILAGSPGSFLYIDNEMKAYQVKGSLEYMQEGEIYDDMKSWVDPKYPAIAAVVLNVEEVYNGADKLA